MRASPAEDGPNSGAWTDSGSLVAAVAAPAAAGISDPALGCLCSERSVDPPAEGRAHGRACRVEQRCCYSPRYCSAGCCSPDAADFRYDLRRDWLEGYKAHLPL